MTRGELTEALADAEHDSWARWVRHMLASGTVNPDGSLTLSPAFVTKAHRQAYTPYGQLSDDEQEGDRREVRLILPAIEEYAASMVARGRRL